MRHRTAEVAELLKFTSDQNQNCPPCTSFGAKFEFQFREHLLLSRLHFETERDIWTLKQTRRSSMIVVCHPIRHFSLIRHNRTVARASVLWRDINLFIYLFLDWLIKFGPRTLEIYRPEKVPTAHTLKVGTTRMCQIVNNLAADYSISF